MANAYITSGEPLDEGQDDDRGLSLKEILVAVRRRWWLVATVAGLVLTVGYWRTMQQPRLYEATATVRLQPGQALLPGVSTMPTRLDYRIDPLLSEQALIKSQQVGERVAEALGLRFSVVQPAGIGREAIFGGEVAPQAQSPVAKARYKLVFRPDGYLVDDAGRVTLARYGDTVYTAESRFVVPRRPEFSDSVAVVDLMPLRPAASWVRAGIQTRVVPSTDLINISFTGDNPEAVRDIANAVARVYQQFASEGIKNSATQKTRFIEQSLAEQERALKAVQDSLKTFKELNQTADITADAKSLFATIDGFERQRLTLENERKAYAALLGKVVATDSVDDELRRLAATGLLENNVALTTKFEQWQDLLGKRQEMLLEGTRMPNNDDLVRLDSTIARTKRDLRLAAEVYLEGVNDRLETLLRTIAGLRGQSERFPPLEATQARLTASVETAQKMYIDLRSQLQLSRISESADGATVRIIDEAMLPTFAVSPDRRRAFFLALLLGLFIGVGLALLVERLDDSIRSPFELSEKFAVPVLGMIPSIKQSEVPELPATTAGVSRIISHADPRSPVAEAYRSLRTNLAFARTQRGLRSIAFTSPGPSDGKSTTVANLAITFAQQGQRTLLVDADLRRAVLDKTFGVSRSPGLTDVIIGSKTVAEAVHETQIPNLFLMSSGQLPPNPSELLGSAAMRDVLQRLTSEYDTVLFDTPPLLAVTDAAVLSTIVDGTIVIARMGSTARRGLWRALGQLRAVHGNVLGSVMNDVSSDVGAYYGGYSYYYYYAYHPDGTNGRPLPGLLGRIRRLTAGVTGGGPRWG